MSSPFSWPTLPSESTGPLRCAPRPPPGKINLRRTGPLTAPPRLQPNAARHPQAGFLILKFFGGKEDRGGRLPEDDVPDAFRGVRIYQHLSGLKNEKTSALIINSRGAYGTRLRFCLQGPQEGDAQGRQGAGERRRRRAPRALVLGLGRWALGRAAGVLGAGLGCGLGHPVLYHMDVGCWA